MLRVLIIDDSQDDALFMERCLRSGDLDVISQRVDTKEGIVEALSKNTWHLILCDYEIPQFDGLRALKLFKETGLDIPFIIVSGVISEEVAVELMKNGAHDYIPKDNLSRLVPVVKRELKEYSVRTERLRAEENLKESEALYRIAIESSGDGFVLVSVIDETIIYVNKRFLEIFGYDDFSEVSDIPFFAMIHPEDRSIVTLFMKRELTETAGSFLYECRGMRKDGMFVPIELSTVIMVSGGQEIYVMYIRDVTERKKSEAERSRLFNLSSDMFVIAGFDGYFKQLNHAWTKTLGWTQGELLSRPYLEFIHPQDRLATLNVFRELSEGKTILSFENRYLTKKGTYRWISCNAYPLVGEELIFSVARDMTEKKIANEEMTKALRDLRKSADAVIKVIAHTVEVRDPYTAGHQKRVAELAAAIAREMGYDQNEIDGIYMAGSIHDLGKISIPAEILSTPRRLTGVEFELIKGHPRVGYDILKSIRFEWPIADIVYQHHERMDGSGYPRGLTGGQICRESRLIAVADVVEAIESHRPYRPALGRDAALEEIEKQRGILYDPDVVNACICLYREKGFSFKE